MQAPLRDRDPRVLGPYRLTGRLGRGGMGTVFLGEDDAGRQVAVKVINGELADDEAFHERFRREVTAARQVSRFCTAAVLDARLDGEPLYVVTEYVGGPTLDEAVKEGGPLRGGDLEALAVNIATALTAIHGAGIVHRDLKPSNVLLSPTGPRVIDFGIARALDAPDGPTRTGQFVGTPAYMAPELMHGEEITAAADVFSWGCVVAYAGTGRAPFAGGTLPETINRVTSAEPDLDGLDPAVRDVVARSLAKAPSERPTVKQLIQTLTGEDEPPATLPTVALRTPDETSSAQPANPLPPPGPAPNVPPSPPRTTVDSGPETHPGNEPPTRPVDEPPTRPVNEPPTRPVDGPPKRPVHTPSPPKARPRRRNHGAVIGAIAAVVGVSFVLAALDLTGDGDGRSGDSGATVAADRGSDVPEIKDEIFEDDFDDEDSGWKSAPAPNWDASYRDHGYALRVLPSTTRTIVDAPVEEAPGSQLIEVKIESTEAGGEAGVFCHGREGYAFLVGSDGSARIAGLSASGEPKDLATGTATGLRGEGDRLQAACVADGSQLNLGLWVNDQPVANTTAYLPSEGGGSAGKSGLLVVRSDGLTGQPKAVFDDFSLCSV